MDPSGEDNFDEESSSERNQSTNKQLSFIGSLSNLSPNVNYNPLAQSFKEYFKDLKSELAYKLYFEFSEKIFNYRLSHEYPLKWSNSMSCAAARYCRYAQQTPGGFVRYVRINLSTKYNYQADRLRDTLVHVMCHAASWIIDGFDDGHGPLWRKWADKAMEIYPELPPIAEGTHIDVYTQCKDANGKQKKYKKLPWRACGGI